MFGGGSGSFKSYPRKIGIVRFTNHVVAWSSHLAHKSGDEPPAVQMLRDDRIVIAIVKRLGCVCLSTAVNRR